VKVFTQISATRLKSYCYQLLLVISLIGLLAPCVSARAQSARSAEGQSAVGRPTVTEEVINNSAHVFPILRESELLENRGTTKIARHVIAPSGVPDTFEYVLEIHESAPNCMEWHRLSGDFREVDGYWKLDPTNLGQHTLVTYAAYVNGGFLMPQVLIRRQARIDMPAAVIALKNKAELDNRIAVRRTEPSAAE
jgi:hypothetical protein